MSRPKKFCITGLTVSVDTFPIVSSLSDELYERTEPVRNCVFRLEILMRQRQAAGGRRQRSFALYDHYLIAAEYRGVRHVQPVHAAVAESNLRAPRHDARFLAGCELTPSRPLVTRKLRLGCSFCRVEGIVEILIAHFLFHFVPSVNSISLISSAASLTRVSRRASSKHCFIEMPCALLIAFATARMFFSRFVIFYRTVVRRTWYITKPMSSVRT